MTKNQYHHIRKALSFRRSYGPIALFLFADAGLILLGLWLVQGEAIGYWFAQVLFAVVFFHHFVILHECGHENSSPYHLLNTITGHYASLFCFMPYFPWKYIHTEHHTWAGNLDRDPTLAAVRNYRPSQHLKNGIIRLAWRSWLPLLAFVQHLVLWTYPLMLFRMGSLRGGRLVRCLLSILLLPSVYIALSCAWPDLFCFGNFWPALLLYLVMVELVNFPHHLGLIRPATRKRGKLPLWEHVEVTRSCYYPAGVSELLLLNFNFHVEHHLFPNLPWFRLRKARELVRTELGDAYRESVGISWNLENRRKDAREVFLGLVPGAAEGPH